MANATYRQAVGVFRDEPSLRNAVDALLVAGIDRSSLSMLADPRRVEAKLGRPYGNISELEDDPAVPTRHYVGVDSRIEGEAALIGGLIYFSAVLAVGIVVASDGTAAQALIAAAVVGALAGTAGYALVRSLERRHSRHLTEQIRRGGIPLWVRVREHEQRVVRILQQHGAEHVHCHELGPVPYGTQGGESYRLSFMRAIGL